MIDGLTIRNGGGGETSAGGGVFCDLASPILIERHHHGKHRLDPGGGIYCTFTASPVIANCTISGNTSGNLGGGIYCNATTAATIVNSTITSNSAVGGGAIYSSGTPLVSNTIFAFNSSGLQNGTPGTPTIRNNCAYGNTDYNYSGLSDPTGTNGNISADPTICAAAQPGFGRGCGLRQMTTTGTCICCRARHASMRETTRACRPIPLISTATASRSSRSRWSWTANLAWPAAALRQSWTWGPTSIASPGLCMFP